MADSTEKEDGFPRVRYRLVNAQGYTQYNTWSEIQEKLQEIKREHPEGSEDYEVYKPKYIIKVTEEYMGL